MATRSALMDLQMFNQQPNKKNTSRLVTIPAIYNVLRDEETKSGVYSEAMLSICLWIHKRGIEVLLQLIGNDPPLLQMPYSSGRDDWETVRIAAYISKITLTSYL